MMKGLGHVCTATAAAVVLLSLSGAAAAAPRAAEPGILDGARPGLLARLPDGRRLNFRCMGAGSPTVILEGGYAANSLAWSEVEPRVARVTRVCAYDRAGYGFSDPGPAPRDGAAIAADLDAGLRAARIRGPFVLVGHSAGALYVRLLAARRPGEIVGMVLAEPSVPHQDARFAAVFGPGAGSLAPLIARDQRCLAAARARALPSPLPRLAACVPKLRPGEAPALRARQVREALRASTWRTRISELENLWTRTSDEIEAQPLAYGDLPLVVLTAGDSYDAAPPPLRARLLAVWAGLHRELAALSSRGRDEIVPGASHLIIIDRPGAVARAIEMVVTQARAAPADRPLLFRKTVAPRPRR